MHFNHKQWLCGRRSFEVGYHLGAVAGHFSLVCFITVRNEVAKVMFLHAFVCPHWGGRSLPQCMLGSPGADTPQEQTPPRSRHPQSRHPPQQTPLQSIHPHSRHPPHEQTPSRNRHPPPGADTPPRRDGHCCGRYTSYWNAFLFLCCSCQKLYGIIGYARPFGVVMR